MKQSLLQLERHFITTVQQYGENAKQSIVASVNLLKALLKENKPHLLGRAMAIVKQLPQIAELTEQKLSVYLLQVQLMEKDKQYEQAYNLLLELLPLEQNQSTKLLQIQVLYHLMENGRQLKLFEYTNQLIRAMDEVQLDIANFRAFERKYQLILVRTYYFQAKYLERKEDDNEAIQFYFEAYKLGEEILGPNDGVTIKSKEKYESLCDKLSVCLQIEEEVPEVEQQKQMKGQNYNVMVNQIYIKQTKKEEKKSMQNVKAKVECRQKSIYGDMKRNLSQHYTIKKNSRPTSAITATTKFPSPRNQGLSMFSMFSNKREQKKETGYQKYKDMEFVLKKNVMELMNPRPVTASQIRVNDCSVIVLKVPNKNPQMMMKSSSNLGLMRKSSLLPSVAPSFNQIHRGSYKRLPPKENEKISGSYRNVTIKSETNVENEVEEEESQSKQSSAQPISIGSKNQSLDPIIMKFLQTHTMEELVEAVEIIVSGLRRLTAPKIDQIQQNFIFNNNNSNNNINVKKHSPNKLIARQSTILMQPSIGFVSIMQKKILENEHTKEILNFFQTSFILISHPIQFYHKLFTDPEQYLWVLENPNFRVQCPQKYMQFEQSEDLNEIDYIRKILASPKSSHALQLVGSIQIANYFRKIQLKFTINKFLDHYEDIGDYENFNDMFDQLLSIYLKQEGLLLKWTDQFKERQIITSQIGQYSQYMLSKILFLLQHKVYVKSINGYKFKTEGPTIQYDILEKNNQIYQERKKYIRQSITQIQQFQKQSQVEKTHIQRKRRRRTRQANNPLPQLLSPLISSEDDQSNQHSYSNVRSPDLNNQEMSIRLNLPPDSSTLIPRMIPTRRKLYNRQTIQIQDNEEDQYTAEQMQDYINYYFPDFKIGPFTEYVPQYVPLKRRPRRLLIDTPYFPIQSNQKKIKFEPYSCIFPKSYLLLSKIFKIDKQYFFVRLSDKLYVEQVSLKNTWKDEFEVSLGDLIKYQIGRTGYLFNILDLEEQIYKCLQIQNCKIHLALPFLINKQELQKQSYQQTLEQRDYDTDLLFLLGFNRFVYVGQQQISSDRIYINQDKAFLVKKQQAIKPKKQIRITLSYEEINKHISRTNERTVNQQNDIQLFHSYNSVAMLKNKTVYRNIKLIIKSHQIQKHFKDQELQGKLSVYGKKYYTTKLSFLQLEQFAHLLCNDTGMKRYLLNYKLIMKRTLIGKQLIQNNYQKSQSKEIRYLLLQNNIKSDEHYQYCNIKIEANKCSNKQIGKAFITCKQAGPLIMMTIMNQKDRTKAHKFLSYSKMANNLILRSTHTYNRLEQLQITQNSERKKYFLSNSYLDDRILIGQQVHNRIVYKKTIYINKQYFLVTVVLIEECFQIYLYNQQNCRRFYFRLHKSDMNQMDQEFLDSIFPVQNMEIVEQLFRPWKLQEINKIYHVVQKAPELFKHRTSRIINQLRQKNKSNSNNLNTLPDRKFQKSLTQNFDIQPAYTKSASLVMPDYDDPPTQRQNCWLHSILIKKQESVFEKKLWDVILSNLIIEDNIVKLNTYSHELSEILFSHDRNCNFICYIPCKEIHQSFRWQPARLRLYSFLNYKTLDAPLDFRGKQIQMAKQCQTVFKQYFKEFESNKPIKCIPSNQEYMNINKFNDANEVGYQLLYKGVFTITQKLMIGVFYYKGSYLVRIYKLNNYVTKKYTIQEIELRIPYIQQLLHNDPFEAGRRISITYRNNLIHAAFLKF